MFTMLMDASLLIQDVQLLCFTVIFGVLALERWSDGTRRWLWYSFLANAAGAIFDLLASHLPLWISHGINFEMIPLSYALLNLASVYFVGRGKWEGWVSGAILVATLPLFLAWSHRPVQFPSQALQDFAIGLECAVTGAILLRGNERSTRAPRALMGGFMALFAVLEVGRFAIAFSLHVDPDAYSHSLEVTSVIAYVVTTSVLPLAFIWMMNARLESDLMRQTLVDPLTLVLNRRGLEQALERELALYRRYGNDLTVAILDLDHFKQLNDAYGHAAGDVVLTAVARLLSKRLRVTDAVGRFGGEEFVLILPHTDIEESAPILEYLCQALREQPFLHLDATIRATCSIGAATTQGRQPVAHVDLLHEADQALYRAKKQGRDQVCYFAPDRETAGASVASSRLHSAG